MEKIYFKAKHVSSVYTYIYIYIYITFKRIYYVVRKKYI